ncbi:MAG: multidrug efflux MFS transporter [Actinobacteria bacterium]|nr:MAG: multidrug efflux MFS transporter [Actinomycetota bacterium]
MTSTPSCPDRSSSALALFVAAAVAIAFADSSVVVLALPQLYVQFHTTIEGVAWVVTTYNAAVAVAALGLIMFVHRLSATAVLVAGLVVFMAASIACSLAGGLGFLIAARTVQGVGAALLLAGALPVLAVLRGSAARGARVWTLAGTFGLALGPALGGVLTQAFDWRAIFAAQAPIAALGLVAAARVRGEAFVEEGWRPSLARLLPANLCLGLVFGALVGRGGGDRQHPPCRDPPRTAVGGTAAAPDCGLWGREPADGGPRRPCPAPLREHLARDVRARPLWLRARVGGADPFRPCARSGSRADS